MDVAATARVASRGAPPLCVHMRSHARTRARERRLCLALVERWALGLELVGGLSRDLHQSTALQETDLGTYGTDGTTPLTLLAFPLCAGPGRGRGPAQPRVTRDTRGL